MTDLMVRDKKIENPELPWNENSGKEEKDR